MALLETWRNLAYGDGLDDKKKEELWSGYFQIEKGIYEQILSAPSETVTGTVKELAEKYNTEILIMTGFLDDHPDADEDGYVMMPNVNSAEEMVDTMASRFSVF